MIEQGYPGGPRPEGAHRAVMCLNCGKPEARRSLVWRINKRLAEMMETDDWKDVLRSDPELADRLRKVLDAAPR